jgi:hypothetical protein
MQFIFSTPVLIRQLWQLKTVVFLHWCLICAVLFTVDTCKKCKFVVYKNFYIQIEYVFPFKHILIFSWDLTGFYGCKFYLKSCQFNPKVVLKCYFIEVYFFIFSLKCCTNCKNVYDVAKCIAVFTGFWIKHYRAKHQFYELTLKC